MAACVAPRIGVCLERAGREFSVAVPRLRVGPSGLASALLTAALGASSPAFAEEPRQAVLTYTVEPGIAGCFERKELEDAVAARLGYVPFVNEAPLSISADVRRKGGGLNAELKVKDPGGAKQRQLGSATRDCGELSRALALAISVAIDPLSLTRAPAPAPAPAPPPEPAATGPESDAKPSTVPAPAPEPAPTPSKPAEPRKRGSDLDPRVRLRLFATGHAVFLALPSTTGGASVGLGVRRRALWADAELRYDLPAAEQADEGGNVRAQLLGGTLSACHGNRRFGICALGALARLSAEGEDVPEPRSASALWAGVGARGSLELPLFGAVFARAHLDGLYRLTPVRLELRRREVWAAGPVSVVAGLGVGGQL